MSESMPPGGPHAANTPGAPPPPGQAPFAPAASIAQDDKTIAVLTHLSGIVHLVIMPLIVWILKKDTSPYLNDQAKEALNFHITMLIYQAILIAVMVVTSCIHMGLGMFLVPVLYVLQVVAAILAAIAANKGEYYRYPMCFRFVK